MRKKLLALVLVTTAVLTFAACGDNSKTSGSSTPSSSAASSSPASSSAASSSAASSSPASSSAETASNLEEWFVEYADDIKDLEDQMNTPSALAGSGVSSIKVAADGNIFVYEYYLDDSMDWSSVSKDDLDTAFSGVIDAYSSLMDDLFAGFKSDFGFELEGLRFVFYTSDGSELYSADVTK